jgi:serine/threonine protein kinase
MKRFINASIIGYGTYGVVYQAKDTKTDKYISIKRILKYDPLLGVESSTLRDISHLNTMKGSNNVLELIDIICDKEDLFIISELYDNDLYDLIQEKDTIYRLSRVKMIVHNILLGLNEIESKGINHHDLKPQNILIKKDKIVICDLGLSTKRGLNHCNVEMICTRWYRPPDILLGDKRYGDKVDIWSIGCIFAEIITGNPLFEGGSDNLQINAIYNVLGTQLEEWKDREHLPRYNVPQVKKDILENIVKIDDPSGLSLLRKMLTMDPLQRITVKEALNHPYFDDMKVYNINRHLKKLSIKRHALLPPILSSNKSDIASTNPDLRRTMVNWMIDLANEREFTDRTVLLAINYQDRMLSKYTVRKKQREILGCVFLWIAEKYNQCHETIVNDYLIREKCTSNNLLHYEKEVLKALKWNLDILTPVDYEAKYGEDLNKRDQRYIRKLILFFSQLPEYTKYTPINIYRTAVSIVTMMKNEKYIIFVTKDSGDIKDCMCIILCELSKISKTPIKQQGYSYDLCRSLVRKYPQSKIDILLKRLSYTKNNIK